LRYRLLTILLLLIIPLWLFSQRRNSYGQNIKLYKADRVILALNYLQWKNLPAQIDLKSVNRGFYLGYFLDNPLGGSRFSLGIGLSLTANNLYSDAIPKYLVDSSESGFTGFVKIKDISPQNNRYVNNKMTFTYISVPLELRLRLGKNEFRKISVGFEMGYMISSYLKYHGDNFFKKSGETVKFKFYDIENVMRLRYGVSFRLAYNRLGIRFFYPLTTIFEEDKGAAFYPLEFGVSLMVF